MVLADAGRGDWILCQVTSQPYADQSAIEITESDFASGSLKKISHVRPAKLFTANLGIITKHVGDLEATKVYEILRAVVSLFEKSISP